MPNPLIIIDNNLELELIQKQHPELRNAPLILLSTIGWEGISPFPNSMIGDLFMKHLCLFVKKIKIKTI